MTGADHYKEAERILRAILSPHAASQEGFDGWARDDLTALAQAHATLAWAAPNLPLRGQPGPRIPVNR
jgi:hypothetical protein